MPGGQRDDNVWVLRWSAGRGSFASALLGSFRHVYCFVYMKDAAVNIPSIRRANKAEAALFFDVTLPTLDKWIREGMPVVQRGARGISWVIDLLHAAEWRYSPRTADGQVDPESMTPAERKLWYDGENQRRKLQLLDRELIPAEEVEVSVSTAFAAVAQTLLALPDNLERRSGLTPEQSESCEQAVHEAMTDLAERLASIAPDLLDSAT